MPLIKTQIKEKERKVAGSGRGGSALDETIKKEGVTLFFTFSIK